MLGIVLITVRRYSSVLLAFLVLCLWPKVPEVQCAGEQHQGPEHGREHKRRHGGWLPPSGEWRPKCNHPVEKGSPLLGSTASELPLVITFHTCQWATRRTTVKTSLTTSCCFRVFLDCNYETMARLRGYWFRLATDFKDLLRWTNSRLSQTWLKMVMTLALSWMN